MIAKEIRTTLSRLPGIKISVRSDYNHIDVTLMQAPFLPTIEPMMKDRISVNQYSYQTSEALSPECKMFFQQVDEIIKKYYWDKSDAITDYFNCAFYYSYGIGRWDKPFIQAPQNETIIERGPSTL